jgi:hypothetical protein
MITHRCKNCLWWDSEHVSVKLIPVTEWKPNPGFCRKKRPNVIPLGKEHHFGAQPVMDADEFCGEFKNGMPN